MVDINKYSGVIKIDDISNPVLREIMLRNGAHHHENKGGFYFFASDKNADAVPSLYGDYSDHYSDYSDYNER